jgi:multimeric flavodoxin WrbA
MKVVGIQGSPRTDGNCATLVKRFLDRAAARGARTRLYKPHAMECQGCIACGSCKTETDYCVLKDDLTEVLDGLLDTDILVLASPVYFGDASSQFKRFWDRTYSLLDAEFNGRLGGGKRAAFILSQGQPASSAHEDVYPRYEQWLRIYGFDERRLLRVLGANDPDTAANHKELLEILDGLVDDWVPA